MDNTSSIPGYVLGQSPQTSPVTLEEFELMKKSVLLGDEDVEALRRSGALLRNQVEEILDVWYGFVGANGHLLASFSGPDGAPDMQYLQAVRRRFGQWIVDTAAASFDQEWLDYQHEIGLRHHRTKKNLTDNAKGLDIVPFRDLFLLVFPITFTLRPFLARSGLSAEEVDAMYNAWLKSCLLQVTLWSYPYVRDGDF